MCNDQVIFPHLRFLLTAAWSAKGAGVGVNRLEGRVESEAGENWCDLKDV